MFIIVTLSTLTFWIDPGSPPARVGGTVTLVLSIVTFNLVVSQDLPKISYSTLLDLYVGQPCDPALLFLPAPPRPAPHRAATRSARVLVASPQ